MLIPIDNLYDWIASLTENTLIYRYYPHGSKKPSDIHQVWNDAQARAWIENMHMVSVLCHDQEPLDWNHSQMTSQQVLDTCISSRPDRYQYRSNLDNPAYWQHLSQLNLAAVIDQNISDRFVLLHSELRSQQVEQYQQSYFEPVYWWSHAIIARDWYRFAESDRRLAYRSNYAFDFNIYARAWSGTREYRLAFLDQLIGHNLTTSSRITFCDHDNGVHFRCHDFANTAWQPQRELTSIPSTSDISSDCSAVYDAFHYEICAIDVVLETLFDDDRLYLTEKILRPIACGKPFILLGPHGSLRYLQSQGFVTFQDLWDESYDTIQDPQARMAAVVKVMQEISRMTAEQKKHLWSSVRSRCEHNRRVFFGCQFATNVAQELSINLTRAVDLIREQHQNGELWFQERRARPMHLRTQIQNALAVPRSQLAALLLKCRKRQRNIKQKTLH